MTDRRVLGFAWLAATVCLWYVLGDLSGWAFRAFGIADPKFASIQLSTLFGGVLALVGSIVAWRNRSLYAFCIETIQETRKVVWPTKKETQDHTVVVVVTSIVLALLLWGFDLVFKRLFGFILQFGA